MSNDNSGPVSSAGSWGLRDSALSVKTTGNNDVQEFNGVWGLKPDADVQTIVDTLASEWFVPTTMKLALIRTARWFIMKTDYFEGDSLVFISQFDGSLSKYFDDFVLNGKERLAAIWGQCVGCPTGEDDTARDIVEYIARGQLKTLAIYDAFPAISYNQVLRLQDWYDKTRQFQRDVGSDDGDLSGKVDAFFAKLNEPFEPTMAAAAVDTKLSEGLQYEDIAERVLGTPQPA